MILTPQPEGRPILVNFGFGKAELIFFATISIIDP